MLFLRSVLYRGSPVLFRMLLTRDYDIKFNTHFVKNKMQFRSPHGLVPQYLTDDDLHCAADTTTTAVVSEFTAAGSADIVRTRLADRQ